MIVRRIALALSAILAVALPTAAQAQASPAPFTSAVRYDSSDRVAGTISPDPDGAGPLKFAATRTKYDDAGQPVLVEKGELSAWQPDSIAPDDWSGFSAFTRLATVYDVMSRKTVETVSGWDAAGQAWVTSTVTQYSYDSDGRLECTAVRMNPAAWSTLPSSACSLGVEGSQGPDRITKAVYDAAGQVLKVQKAVGTPLAQDYATYTYTLNGKQATVRDANGNLAGYTYDGFDRPVRWNFPDKTTTGAISASDYEEYSYDPNGNRLGFRKRDGNVIGYGYDALDRMTLKDIPGGAATDVYTGYDLSGLQLYARFAGDGGLGIASAYDGFGRLSSTTDTTSGTALTLSYQYDADSNRVRVTHPDGVFFTYDYDGLDRQVAIRENGGATVATIAYDTQGRRLRDTRGVVGTSYAYDAVSRLAAMADDLGGNRITNSQFVSTDGWRLGYDPQGIATLPVVDMWQGKGFIKVSFSATASSQIASIATSEDWFAVTGGERLAASSGVEGLGPVASLQLVMHFWDANRNYLGGSGIGSLSGPQPYNTKISGFATAPANAAFARLEVYMYTSGPGNGSFDMIEPMVTGASAGQTTVPAYPVGDNVKTALAYNPASQIVSKTRSNDAYTFTGYYNVNRNYAVNGLNQYTTGGPANYSYDPNGNLTGDGTSGYSYDVENRLIARAGGLTLSYDPNGRLWRTAGGPSGTTRFLYDGDELVAEYDGAGNVLRRYVHGASEDDPNLWYEGAGLSDRRSLQTDTQGSIVSTADAAGSRIAINTYDEYGIPGASNLGRFQYTGQAWLPDLGMYYYKARIYSPTLGRFMQTDPIGYKDQVNLYAYVGNDPIDGRDPSGLTASDQVLTPLPTVAPLPPVSLPVSPPIMLPPAQPPAVSPPPAGVNLPPSPNGPTIETSNGRGGQQRGDPGRTARPDGSGNPDKKFKPGENPGTRIFKDPTTGKPVTKPWPEDPRRGGDGTGVHPGSKLPDGTPVREAITVGTFALILRALAVAILAF